MNDRQRVEYALIPALLESYIKPLIGDNEIDSCVALLKEVQKAYIPNIKLARRVDRIANKIIAYTISEKFDSRKAVVTIAQWLPVLGLDIHFDEYWNLLDEIGKTIRYGLDNSDDKELEGLDKVYASAGKQVLKIHKLAQEEGYFKGIDLALENI